MLELVAVWFACLCGFSDDVLCILLFNCFTCDQGLGSVRCGLGLERVGLRLIGCVF